MRQSVQASLRVGQALPHTTILPVTMVRMDATAAYLEHRNLLMGIAYRILGRVADAEDVVQEAWLRWSAVKQEEVDNPRAFLIHIATNLALDRLRRIKAQHEAYVGEWLPEPILTDPDPANRVELAESVSMAMLVVLETLSPLERVVFVLNEAFGISYAELAEILGRSAAAVRQIAHRARQHVEERRARFDQDADRRREVAERFLAAAASGELKPLVAALAPDVTLVADGGGLVRAPLRPVVGAEKVARFLVAAQARQPLPAAAFHLATINGGPGIVIEAPGVSPSVVLLDSRDGAIATIYLLANPQKLSGLSVRPVP
jgi:RNA polymerase sigma-70 factor (ECF subfamily)